MAALVQTWRGHDVHNSLAPTRNDRTYFLYRYRFSASQTFPHTHNLAAVPFFRESAFREIITPSLLLPLGASRKSMQDLLTEIAVLREENRRLQAHVVTRMEEDHRASDLVAASGQLQNQNEFLLQEIHRLRVTNQALCQQLFDPGVPRGGGRMRTECSCDHHGCCCCVCERR